MRQTRRLPLAGESNFVGGILRLHDDDGILKTAADAGDRPFKTPVLHRQIDHHEAAWSQSAITIVIEALTAQLWRLTASVKAIDHQNITRAESVTNKVGAVLADHLEPVIIPWNIKLIPQCNHVGIDLHNDDGSFG